VPIAALVVVVAGVSVRVVFGVIDLGERHAGILLAEPCPPLPPEPQAYPGADEQE